MSIDLRVKVSEFLREKKGQHFTARNIAESLFEKFPGDCRDLKTRPSVETDADVVQELVRNIASGRRHLLKTHAQIKTTEGRPRYYCWTDKTDEEEVAEAERPSSGAVHAPTEDSQREKELYPLLSDYLWSEYHIYSKRIDEKRSSNTRGAGGNRWLHPDLVAMEDLTTDWHEGVKNLVDEHSDRKAKLWSFEVKVCLNMSNVRAAFFQAASNSTWANYGYLVAATIQDERTVKELRMLRELHGIGLITIDRTDPVESSQILIPARERDEVNWELCSRISDQNPDFKDFLKLVSKFHQTGKPCREDWGLSDTD